MSKLQQEIQQLEMQIYFDSLRVKKNFSFLKQNSKSDSMCYLSFSLSLVLGYFVLKNKEKWLTQFYAFALKAYDFLIKNN